MIRFAALFLFVGSEESDKEAIADSSRKEALEVCAPSMDEEKRVLTAERSQL